MPLLGQAYVDITGDLTGLKTSLVTARQEVQTGLETISTQQVEVVRRGHDKILAETRRFARELGSILRIGIIAYFASSVANMMGAFARAVRENTDEANEAFAKSIPIIGRLSTAIVGMVSEFAGWATEIRKANESNKELDATFKTLNEDLERRKNLLKEIALLKAMPEEAARLKIQYKYETPYGATKATELVAAEARRLELAKLEAEEYKKAREPIEKVVGVLREQTEAFGKSEYEINRYKLTMAGATLIELAEYDALALVAKKQEEAKKKWEEGQEAVRRYREEIADFARSVWTETRTPLENLRMQIEKLDEAFLTSGKEGLDVYRRKLEAIREELKGQLPEQRIRFIKPSEMWQQMTMQISDIPKRQLDTQQKIKDQLIIVNTRLKELDFSPIGK